MDRFELACERGSKNVGESKLRTSHSGSGGLRFALVAFAAMATLILLPASASAITPTIVNSAGNQWRRLRAKIGMDEFTLHDLRHFFASGLIADGCDVVTVQHALGHSSPSITLNTYSHLWPKAEERTRAAAAGLISAALADSVRTVGASPQVNGMFYR